MPDTLNRRDFAKASAAATAGLAMGLVPADGVAVAAGSTGRGEASLFNLSSFLVVDRMRACARTATRASTS